MNVCRALDCLDCVDDGNSVINSYEDRLLTFATWKIKVNPKEMAKAGFYYTGKSDIVRCSFCHWEFHEWKEGDDPLADHYKYVKHCDWAKVQWKCRQFKTPVAKPTSVRKPEKHSRFSKTLFLTLIFTVFAIFHGQHVIKAVCEQV